MMRCLVRTRSNGSHLMVNLSQWSNTSRHICSPSVFFYSSQLKRQRKSKILQETVNSEREWWNSAWDLITWVDEKGDNLVMKCSERSREFFCWIQELSAICQSWTSTCTHRQRKKQIKRVRALLGKSKVHRTGTRKSCLCQTKIWYFHSSDRTQKPIWTKSLYLFL